jgi:hypothetical protein
MKGCIDLIGYRARDLPPCSAVRQPTAPPRAPHTYLVYLTTLSRLQSLQTVGTCNDLQCRQITAVTEKVGGGTLS